MSNSSVKSNNKDIELLLDHWHEQGARIERPGGARSTKSNAIKVYAPNGRDIVIVHTTQNSNGLRRTIDKGRKVGLTAFPGDPHVKNQEAQDMSTIAPQQIDLPPMITDSLKGRPSDLLIGSARGAIEYLKRHGSDTFWTREVTSLCLAYGLLSEGGMRNLPATIYWLGYRPVEEKKYGRGAQYRWQLIDALDKSKNEILPRTFLKGEVASDTPEPEESQIEPDKVEDGFEIVPVEDEIEALRGDPVDLAEALAPVAEEVAEAVAEGDAGSEAIIWQAEAERLEAELIAEREAFQRRSEQVAEERRIREGVEQALADARQRLSEAERQYAQQHEKLLTAEDTNRKLNERIAGLDAEITLLEKKAERGENGEWRDLTRVPNTMDELNNAAALLGMKIRIQVAPN